MRLKGGLLHTLIKADESSINIFIDIQEEISKVNIDYIDLARILGILMDNIIEAATKSEERVNMIGIFKK